MLAMPVQPTRPTPPTARPLTRSSGETAGTATLTPEQEADHETAMDVYRAEMTMFAEELKKHVKTKLKHKAIQSLFGRFRAWSSFWFWCYSLGH